MEFREIPNITTGRRFETNNNHLIVNTTSPFHSVDSRQYKVRINEENIIKYNNDGSMDILASNSTIFNAPNEVVDDIIRDCAANRNKVTNETFIEDLGHRFMDTMPQRTQVIPPHVIDTQYTPSCSKDDPKNVNFDARGMFANESNRRCKHKYFPTDVPTVDSKKSAEKTTYCRPMLNLYSQQFVHKTMQRNARLQKLVHKLVLARQREKQETWNNYINELKNKHRYEIPQPRRISTHYPEEQDGPELIDDYYNTRFICGNSYPCQNLLQEFYGASDNMQSMSYNKQQPNYYNDKSHYMRHLYENDPYCYPTASQGCFKMLQKERDKQKNDFADELKPRPHARFYRNSTIVIDNESPQRKIRKKKEKHRKKVTETEIQNIEILNTEIVNTELLNTEILNTQILNTEIPAAAEPKSESEEQPIVQDESLQTEPDVCCLLEKCTMKNPQIVKDKEAWACTVKQEDQSTKQEYEKVSDNVLKLKQKIQQNEDKQKQKSLAGIEGKLDTLIQSVNTFVTDMKSKSIISRINKSTSVCECIDTNMIETDINEECSEACGHGKDKQIFYSMVGNGMKSALAFSDGRRKRYESLSKIDKILHEEMDKSNKIKRDIESLLKIRNDRPSSVQISFDIPTRERSTEVTHSLSRTRVEIDKNSTIEEISPSMASNNRNMTIAVNTDPLGLLALLRVSTETMKQMMSFMPQIDCYSYLSMLQFPQLSPSCVSHYICNICGAAFRQPSQLSDHIQEHNIGNTRDCCICRHALDKRNKHNSLYSCQYCGKRFTRAYCCELHQQSCARRLGMKHDVASSLMLLK